MKCKIVKLESLSGALASIYSVIIDGENQTLFENFNLTKMKMNKSKPGTYKSDLLENMIHEISPAEQKSTDRKMMLAARIYNTMKAKGIKNGQLAAILRRKPSEITKWLSGTHNFTIETLWEIGDVLGIKLINIEEQEEKQQQFELRATGKTATV